MPTPVPRTLLLAAPRSFCAGVERAVEIVERALAQRGQPVYVRKQIVHNAHVVAELESRGAVFVDELATVPRGATVVFSAHGVSPAVRDEAGERDLRVIDATCPLVTKVHAEARRFAGRGDTVLLIGHAGHEEVDGTLGEAPGATILVEDVARARTVKVSDPASDDICYATTNRQHALAAVAESAEVVLVVGSDNSANSRRLVELARRGGTPAYLIDEAGDIRPEWIDGVRVTGLTAGASAPPGLVDEVIAALAPDAVVERETATETVHFTLPLAVRSS